MFRLIRAKPVMIMVVALLVVFVALGSAQGQGSLFGGIMTYEQANQWVLFTDQTNSWHAPLAIHNSAAPSNSVTEFTVNTDNQFEIQSFSEGTLASYLDLDTDGSAALYGTGGGGIGMEANSGDTCLPSIQTAPCGPNSLRISTNGTINHYRGQATAGNGISTILYFADATLSGSFGPYTIFTTNASGYAGSGMYRLSGYITATNTQLGSTLQFVAGYTDEVMAQTQTTGTPTLIGVPGANVPFSFVFFSQAGKPITISTVTNGGPTYTIHLRLEAL
jgi:hypothetical protein